MFKNKQGSKKPKTKHNKPRTTAFCWWASPAELEAAQQGIPISLYWAGRQTGTFQVTTKEIKHNTPVTGTDTKMYSQTNKQSHASPQLPAQEIFPSTKKPNRRTTIIDFISTIIQPRMANPTSFCLFKYCSFIPNVNPLKNKILQTRPLDAFSNIVLCHRRRYLKQQSSYFLKIFSIWSIFYYTLYFFEKEANIHRLNCLSTMVT